MAKKQKTIKQIKGEHWGRVQRGINLPLRYRPELKVLEKARRKKLTADKLKLLQRTFLRAKPLRNIKKGRLEKVNLLKNIQVDMTLRCKAKKAQARHDYFGMISSGKGASRTNPKTDRFNSRC